LGELGRERGEHPLFAQHMFRLKNDRFEQIGQSWLKHGFTAVQQTLCSTACLPSGNGAFLGVNCSDPYSASLNGAHTRLGPKFEVNPATGVYPYPATDLGLTGDVIYKRMQVHNSDLDRREPRAAYFRGNPGGHARRRHRQEPPQQQFLPAGQRDRHGGQLRHRLHRRGDAAQKAAIEAWGALDPTVVTTNVTDGANGRIIVAAKVTALGGSTWHYEYAVQNQTSSRAVRSFRVPIPAGAVVTTSASTTSTITAASPSRGPTGPPRSTDPT